MKKTLSFLLALVLLLSCANIAMASGGDTPTLTILMEEDPLVTDYKDNTFTHMIEEDCNVNLEFSFLPSADSKTKLNVMLSSGEALPDVLNYGLSLQDVYNYASAGVFVAIDDKLDALVPNFKKWDEAHPELLIREKMTAADGHIYSLPKVFFASADSLFQNCWIDQEWLDTLGLAMPTTVDELYDVLVAFRDQDPNGNGLADEIPMTGSQSSWSKHIIDFLLNSYVYWNASDHINVKNGEVYATFATDEYKEGLLFIKKLLAEGLLDPQCFTQTADQEMALVMTEGTNTLGCWMNMTVRKPNVYVNLKPLTGPNGIAYAAYSAPSVGCQWFVTADCKDVDLALTVGNYLFSGDQELCLTGRFGEKGIYWDYWDASNPGNLMPTYELPEGILPFYIPIDPETGEEINAWNNPANQHWRRNYPHFHYKFEDAIVRDPETSPNQFVQAAQVTGQQGNIPPLDIYIPYITYEEAETQVYNDIRPDLMTYVDESQAAFLTGTRDIEAEWDSYLAQLDALRLPEFIQTVQGAYDRLYK